MATSYYCLQCGEHFGKDKETPKRTHCGNCGASSYNEYGYNEDAQGNDIGTDAEND